MILESLKVQYDNYSPYHFNAKEVDPETGYHYYGARYYNSNLSIWLSVDPLSHLSPNETPFHFVSNNPIMRTDPDGRNDDKWTVNVDTGELKHIDKTGGDEEQIITFINNKGTQLGVQIIYGYDFFIGPASDGVFASSVNLWEGIRDGYNEFSLYNYSSSDLRLRYKLLNDSEMYRGFRLGIEQSERAGSAQPISAKSYWEHYGTRYGQLKIGLDYVEQAVDLMDYHSSSGSGGLRQVKGYNPTRGAYKPKCSNFADYLNSRAGKNTGTTKGSGNWMKVQRDFYYLQRPKN